MKQLQKQVKDLYKKYNYNKVPAEILLIAIQEELGETSASFLSNHPKYFKKTKNKRNEHTLEEEIGDLMFLILAFCNKQNIDCEKWVNNTIKKLEKRNTNIDNI